ncbi:MAG: UbiA family prenyltransferase [Bryobacterales bacterium]|nr:UbiA family prenyltransferase [Bryobacterales bacterium]
MPDKNPLRTALGRFFVKVPATSVDLFHMSGGPVWYKQSSAVLPLCVDLDGTLIHTDLLSETLVQLLTTRPWLALMPLIWIVGGKTRLKSELAQRVTIEAALLPYDERVLSYLSEQRSRGRKLFLLTECNDRLAKAIADHLDLFEAVITSDSERNSRGDAKAGISRARFERFLYLGKGRSDLSVWSKAEREGKTDVVFPREGSRIRALVKTLRPHQWSKNLLAFVPIITSHQLLDGAAWLVAFWVAVAFSVTASSIYVLNDLTDLAADRAHPRKRRRPLASGSLPLVVGIALAPLLLSTGLIISAAIHILPLMLLYTGVSMAYTFRLKEQPLVDVFILAFLYLLRLYAGGLSTGHYVSMWLLGFSAFLFLALALMKRSAELADAARAERKLHRRGYAAGDLTALQTMGISSSFASSMLLALYVQNSEVAANYSSLTTLWALVPLMLFWQARMWLFSTRGCMHDDPIVFAAKDWVTWLVLIAILAIMTLASHF